MNEVDRFWLKNRVWTVVGAAVIALLLNGGLRVLNVSLSPTGQVLNVVVFWVWVVQIALFVLLVLNFIFRASKTTEMGERGRVLYTAALVYAIVGLLSVPVGNGLARPIRQQGYEAFVAENQFLIDAIEAFEQGEGRPPERLLELYPDYLGDDVAAVEGDAEGAQLRLDVAYTSIDQKSGGNVLYDYRPAEGNQPWRLQVAIYLGSFQSIRFVYEPDEQYSNRYTRVGVWGVAD